MTTTKAIIIGAGPAGLTLALRLQQTTRIKCSIYELRPEPTTMGGAVGIPSNGLRLLDRLGVHDALLARGSSRSGLAICCLDGSTLGTREDTVSSARAKTGYGYVRVKRADLVDVLLHAVQEAQIPVYFGKKLTAIHDDLDGHGDGNKVTAVFSDDTTDSADLLVGCDGIHSAVRRLYINPSLEPEYSGIAALFSIIPTSALSGPENVLSQLTSGIAVTPTEEGMFLAMPCTATADEIFWGFQREVPLPESDSLDTRDGWEVYGREEVEGFKANLHKVLGNARGDWGQILKQLVDETSVVKFYPIYRLPLGGSWSRGRCLVLGDAAHAMQPHAGQGVSMALEDVFLLSRLLGDSTRSLEGVFERYDRIRRPRVDEIYELSAGNAEVRRNTGSWGLWLKEKVIRVVFALPWGLAAKATGFAGEHLVYDIDEETL